VMLASITLLPAVLGFVGHVIDRLRVPGLHRDESDHRASFWFRWSRLVQRRPIPAGIVGTLVLLVLAIPLFSIELGFTDEGNDAETSSARQAYDLLADGFGPGFNGPLLLVSRTDDPDDFQQFKQALARSALDDGVAGASPAFQNEGKTVAIATIFPTSSPQDRKTEELIGRLRAELPDDPNIEIGGITALFVDFSDYLAGRLFYFIGAVLVLSFLLLMVVFRSLLIPLKAGVVNLLGIAASYGIIVAVFQWGWLADVVGIQRTGPIEPFLPLMLFAIVFGLSMDYEVFLMSRIREEYVRTKRNDIAVADGLAATARVITAAAAIMVTLFLSFVMIDERTIKLFGLGLAVAIFLDATVIRMVVVPSFMELFGDANWYLPRWLDRILPRVSIDAPPDHLTLPLFEDEPVVAPEPAAAKAKAKAKARPKVKAKPKAKPKPKPTATAKPKATPRAKPKKPVAKRKPAARR
jgi:putative drug exporter of the RND superfamily